MSPGGSPSREPRRHRHDGSNSPERDRRSRPSHRSHKDHRGDRSPRGDRERSRHRDRSRDRRRRQRSMSPTDAPSRHSPRSPKRHRDRRRDEDRSGHSRRRRSTSRERRKDRERGREHRRPRSRDDDRHSRRERDGSPRSGRARAAGDGEDTGRDGKQVVRRGGPLPPQADSFAVEQGEEPPKPKEQPSFAASGALAAASNSIAQADGSTIVLKYHEPPEARKPPPKDQWKLFVFKGEQVLDTVPLSQRSCWLVGRDPAVVDMMAEHPSVSKQHAVIQFRYLEKRNEYGDKIGRVKPYLIDLESANGTMLNSDKVPDSRYLELQEKDLIQFGQSTREYVLMLAPKD